MHNNNKKCLNVEDKIECLTIDLRSRIRQNGKPKRSKGTNRQLCCCNRNSVQKKEYKNTKDAKRRETKRNPYATPGISSHQWNVGGSYEEKVK